MCEEVNFSSENSEESKNDAYKGIGCKNSGHPDEFINKSKDDEIMDTNNNSGKHFILCEPDVAENTAKDNKKETINYYIPALKKSYEIEIIINLTRRKLLSLTLLLSRRQFKLKIKLNLLTEKGQERDQYSISLMMN